MVQPPPYGHLPPMPPYGGWHDPYYGAIAPKPGCIPLRPLAVGEVLGGSFTAIRRNARTVLFLAAALGVIQAVLGAVLQHFTSSGYRQFVDNSNPNAPQIHWSRLVKLLAGSLGLSLLGSLFAAVLTGMVIVVVTEDVVGRTASIANVWAKVRSRLWRLIVLSLVVGVLAAFGLVLCLAPGVWLWGIWAVAVPVLIIENRGIGASLSRSYSLVRGTFWRVWGIRALGFVITFLISGLISGVFAAIAAGVTSTSGASVFSTQPQSLPLSYLVIAAIGSAIATTFTAPILASVDSLIYVDLRMRKENLAIELQQAAAGFRPPPSQPPPQLPPYQQPQLPPPYQQPPPRF